MNQTTRRTFLGLGIAATTGAASWQWRRMAEAEYPVYPEAPGRFSLKQVKADLLKLVPLHERKKPAQPGDWLAREGLVEYGQTFAEYYRGRQRVCEKYKSLYVLPLGKFSQAEQPLIASVVEALGCCFGMPTTMLDSYPLDKVPPTAERTIGDGQRQLLTQYLLDTVLPPRLPKDAAALLGLTNIDLWPGEGWNYVFGMATLEKRVGVWSTARFGNPASDEQQRQKFFRRLLKIALHETGHMFGIPHCIAYECGMNGANHLTETDRQQIEFCPECQAKLWWTCDYPPQKRCESLLAYYKKEGLADEAKYHEQALAAMK